MDIGTTHWSEVYPNFMHEMPLHDVQFMFGVSLSARRVIVGPLLCAETNIFVRYGPGVDSACNRNEYQADNLTAICELIV
jgi:hypothetical protein